MAEISQAVLERAAELEQRDQLESAAALYSSILANEPGNIAALANLAAVKLRTGDAAGAIKLLRKALRRAPAAWEPLVLLGDAYAGAGEHAKAAVSYRRALQSSPAHVGLHYALACTLQTLGRRDEAIAAYRQVLMLQPDHAEALNEVGILLQEARDGSGALSAFAAAVRLKPDCAVFQHNYGNILLEAGRLDEARTAYQRAIEADPENAVFWRHLAEVTRFTPDHPDLGRLRTLADAFRVRPANEMAEVHFALGKASSDVEDHATAFHHFIAANRYKRASIAYDETRTLGALQALADIFTGETIQRLSEPAAAGDGPIFVVGMPRSGTTLVERILASQGEVVGAGELDEFGFAVADVIGVPRTADISAVLRPLQASLTPATVREIGTRYRELVRGITGGARRFIDKLPSNFLWTGLIHLALPDARIIHVRRDPVDTCMSCFSKNFVAHKPYAFDLGELGRYYAAYDRLMQHWARVLPPGRVWDIRYEDLVSTFEQTARSLLEACGLVWNPACAQFHESPGWVRSASAAQVRQPLYKSSVGRAAVYDRAMLAPLLRGLAGLS